MEYETPLNYIRISLISDIDIKLARLREREICLIRRLLDNSAQKQIEREAMMHSCRIEIPRCPFISNKPFPRRNSLRRCLKDLKRAYSWGVTNFRPECLNEEYIKEVAGRIDPCFHKGMPAEYRIIGKNEKTEEEHYTGVRASGSNFTAPGPEKIPTEMKNFCEELRFWLSDNSIPHVLVAAAYAHLHLARIHPFEDTNGRTARMIQNIILQKNNMPPAIIYEGERFDYCRNLENAMLGWRKRTGLKSKNPSPEERAFYEYIAGKVSSSLDRILS